ncbi:MAG TPA: Rnf-Nqr domain containing protein [Clostridia bacterium]|nr:Rnf-Nqr domain containing protein [Clostridia bacterium]
MSNKVNQSNLSASSMLFRGAFVFNPVLVQVIGICPIVAATVSLSASALMAAITVLLLIICETLASVALKGLPAWVRVAIYFIIGLIVACPVMYYADLKNYAIHVSIGIYFPLLAVSSLAALRCEKFAVKNTVRASFIDAVGAGIGYSAVFLIVGMLRELLGSGTIGGKTITEKGIMPGMLMTFGGFIVLGMLAAIHKAIVLKFFPAFENDMAFKIKMTTAQPLATPVNKPMRTKKSSVLKNVSQPMPEKEENSTKNSDESNDSLDECVVYTPDLPKEKNKLDEPVLPPSDNSEISGELSDVLNTQAGTDGTDQFENETNQNKTKTVTDYDEDTNDTDKTENSALRDLISATLNNDNSQNNSDEVDAIPNVANDREDDMASNLEEDFERNMTELFEQFKKRNNLDD